MDSICKVFMVVGLNPTRREFMEFPLSCLGFLLTSVMSASPLAYEHL